MMINPKGAGWLISISNFTYQHCNLEIEAADEVAQEHNLNVPL